jgi:hypothetical protein
MIRKLLLLLACIFSGLTIHAQINVSNSDKTTYNPCFSSEAIGYFNEDGVFYYNYSRTTKVSSTKWSIYNMQMSEKYMVWMELNDTTYSLYLYDGAVKRKISTTSVKINLKPRIAPQYILWLGKAGAVYQVFRFDRTTGITTQLTNEPDGCIDLVITNPQTSAFSFVYSIPNKVKTGYEILIASVPGTNRKVIYDEFRSPGVVSGGSIYFIKYVDTANEVFRCNPGETGVSRITWNYPYNSGIVSSSDKYIGIVTHADGQSYLRVVNGETQTNVISVAGKSISGIIINQDRFVWTQNDGNDNEIMYYNGKSIIQVTDNNFNELSPQVTAAGNIFWSEYINGVTRLSYFDASTGSVSQLDREGDANTPIGTAGENLVTNNYQNGKYQVYLYSASSYKFSSLDFRCDETSKNGTVVLSIDKPLKPGVLGLDFKVVFDPSAVSVGSVDLLNPTDANGNTAAMTYTVSGNTITISYYLRSVPGGSSIIATGPIVGINLVRNSATTYTSDYSLLKISEVDESYAIGSVKTPGPVPAAYNISTETYVGQLLYGANASKPVVHSAANPAQVFQTDFACVRQPLTPTVVNPGTTGIFRINKNTVNSNLQFVKDLPGSYNIGCASSNIMTFMNGSDWALAADISKGNSSAVTSPLQYIAADVNMDGRITAGDASLISSRSVLKICEYPQKWNYVLQNGIPVPGPNYKPSKDFVFVHESMFIAAASKDAVPLVTDCLPMPDVQNCPAIDALATKYAAILLGDANLSYYPSNVLTRIGMTNDVVFTSTEDPEIVNVSGVCTERLKALDFRIVLPEGVKVEDVVPAHPDVNLNWNAIDSLLLVTSYVDGDTSSTEQLFNIILKNGLLNNFSSGDFYINGEPAGFANRIVNGTADRVRKQVKISPNPTAGKFKIEFRESKSGYVTVSDLEGKVISRTFTDGTSQELNIEEAPAGVYFVKVEAENTTEVYKIVKQ